MLVLEKVTLVKYILSFWVSHAKFEDRLENLQQDSKKFMNVNPPYKGLYLQLRWIHKACWSENSMTWEVNRLHICIWKTSCLRMESLPHVTCWIRCPFFQLIFGSDPILETCEMWGHFWGGFLHHLFYRGWAWRKGLKEWTCHATSNYWKGYHTLAEGWHPKFELNLIISYFPNLDFPERRAVPILNYLKGGWNSHKL